jgi:hypothetical protein
MVLQKFCLSQMQERQRLKTGSQQAPEEEAQQ